MVIVDKDGLQTVTWSFFQIAINFGRPGELNDSVNEQIEFGLLE